VKASQHGQGILIRPGRRVLCARPKRGYGMDKDVEMLEELADSITPMAIRVAATLRLADRIVAGSATSDELAADVDADPDALARLLRYLVARGVFAEPEPGRFALTGCAQPLRDDHPSQLRPWLDLSNALSRPERAFGALLDVVRTGKPGYPMVYGHTFWADLASDPAFTASFDALMAANLGRRVPWLVALDWSASQHVVDVGGGTGALLVALLRAHPHLRGTLVDQPATVAAAKRALAAEELSTRCDVVAGSFFEPLPAGADVYVLTSILHDWNDTDATAILRRCAQAAGPGGRVLLGEFIGTGGDAGDEDRKKFTDMDLHMLVYFGGRERTREEFVALTEAAGLVITSITPVERGYSLIDCTVR
jgi:SAM-dependent methyltransferase